MTRLRRLAVVIVLSVGCYLSLSSAQAVSNPTTIYLPLVANQPTPTATFTPSPTVPPTFTPYPTATPMWAAWPMARHDPTGSRRTSADGAAAPIARWAYPQPSIASASPPVIGSDGTVYVAWDDSSQHGHVHAIRPNGSLKWTYDITPSIGGVSIGPDGTLLATTRCYWPGNGVPMTSATLISLSAAGGLNWTRAVSGCSVGSPIVTGDGTTYLSNNTGLYAINNRGDVDWQFSQSDSFASSLAVVAPDGTIYLGLSNHNLYALNPNGTTKWMYFDPDDWMPQPLAVVPDGTLYLGDQSPTLKAFSPNGTLKWRTPTSMDVYTLGVGGDGTLYAQTFRDIEAISPGGITAWKYSIGGQEDSPLVVAADGTIYFILTIDGLVVLNPNGSVKSKSHIDSYSYTIDPAIGSDGTIYVVGVQSNLLYAFGAGP